MPVVDVVKDPEALTMTITAQFPAPRERVWQIWSDPRQLERWWGPPTWPATFVEHDFVPGGAAHYYMTGPEGEKSSGWWRFLAIEAPERLEIEDGFDEGSDPSPDGLPSTRFLVTFTETGGVTTMTTVTTFATAEALQQMLAMGMEEGIRSALSQVDGLLGVPA